MVCKGLVVAYLLSENCVDAVKPVRTPSLEKLLHDVVEEENSVSLDGAVVATKAVGRFQRGLDSQKA